MKNWAGSLTYSATEVLRPTSVEEAQELVARAGAIRALGTRHSFSEVGDSAADGVLLATDQLDRVVDVGTATVTVEAGIRYGELSATLEEHGLALANLASLPHISVGGAVATGTHGSGVGNRSLAAAVAMLELVGADGSIRVLRRGDDDFDGAVVGLGALGVVVRLSLDVVPAFELRQYVFEQLPWSRVEAELDDLLGGGYSVSLFTRWRDEGVDQIWVKTEAALDSDAGYFGAAPAREPRNPVPGASPENCTPQLGAPGPSGERLPHFRLGFKPSSGAELQSEYVVDRAHGVEAIRALRRLGPLISPLLLIAEIRAVAADTLWLSPFHERDGICFHFTWKQMPSDVLGALSAMEAALAPLRARPHWGKLFVTEPRDLDALYPGLSRFRALRARLDDTGKFANAFVTRYAG